MHRFLTAALLATLAFPAPAQARLALRKAIAPSKAVPIAAVPKKVAADVTCQTPLGVGVTTKQVFCDVFTGRDPADGIVITLPPHEGSVTLTFELHNRHTYSEEEVKERRAYRRYTATIGVLTMDNTLISRAVVQSEFRPAADLVDRVSGGAGPGGLKAIAPTGAETITITIPEEEERVSILGDKLTVERLGGTDTYTQPGRAIADISRVKIEYWPGLSARPTRRTR